MRPSVGSYIRQSSLTTRRLSRPVLPHQRHDGARRGCGRRRRAAPSGPCPGSGTRRGRRRCRPPAARGAACVPGGRAAVAPRRSRAARACAPRRAASRPGRPGAARAPPRWPVPAAPGTRPSPPRRRVAWPRPARHSMSPSAPAEPRQEEQVARAVQQRDAARRRGSRCPARLRPRRAKAGEHLALQPEHPQLHPRAAVHGQRLQVPRAAAGRRRSAPPPRGNQRCCTAAMGRAGRAKGTSSSSQGLTSASATSVPSPPRRRWPCRSACSASCPARPAAAAAAPAGPGSPAARGAPAREARPRCAAISRSSAKPHLLGEPVADPGCPSTRPRTRARGWRRSPPRAEASSAGVLPQGAVGHHPQEPGEEGEAAGGPRAPAAAPADRHRSVRHAVPTSSARARSRLTHRAPPRLEPRRRRRRSARPAARTCGRSGRRPRISVVVRAVLDHPRRRRPPRCGPRGARWTGGARPGWWSRRASRSRKRSNSSVSARTSRAAVGSSRISSPAPPRTAASARASAMRCHCPPRQVRPALELAGERPCPTRRGRRARRSPAPASPQRPLQRLVVVQQPQVPEAHVLAQGQPVAHEVLEDDADAPPRLARARRRRPA